MSTFAQLREGFNESVDTLMHGWRQLADLASGALTKFLPARQQEQGGEAGPPSHHGARWGLMAAEMFDDEKAVVVRLEAPGMEQGDFDIQVRENTLVIRGEKKYQRESQEGRYHLMECAYGRFERALHLPAEVDDTKAEARYKRGLLTITLPKTEQQRGRRIKVLT